MQKRVIQLQIGDRFKLKPDDEFLTIQHIKEYNLKSMTIEVINTNGKKEVHMVLKTDLVIVANQLNLF